jgi:GMP synthase (glutamine-hydrolysing)
LLQNNVPILGICFGLQFISQYLGGKVEEGEHGWESGIADIHLTNEGQSDVLFKGVNNTFQAPTSHKEVVTRLPNDVIELAYNDMYRFQALRFQDNAWGVQFHPEMTRDFIASHVMAHDSSNTQELERIQTADLSDVQKLTLNLL